jgi:4-aminobutyrate aminotransferase-like enzyme
MRATMAVGFCEKYLGGLSMDSLIERIQGITEEEIAKYSANLMVGGGTPSTACIVSGEGVKLTDINGKSYIDCTSQSWAMYLGFGNQEIRQAVYEHMNTMSHIHQGFDTRQRYLLANELASLAPKNLNRVSFTVGGGPAVEAAMKIALKNTKNAKNFVCLWDSYHGSGLTAAGASWVTTKSAGRYTGQENFISNVNSNFTRIPNPYCYRCHFGKDVKTCNAECVDFARLMLEKGVTGPIAGIIVEPVQASGGQLPAPKKYLQKMRKLADDFGALLIYDEIQTYMRIGDWYAANYYGVEPDIIVLGKGLGAGLPIAAIIIHDRLDGFTMNAEELHTFANNSVSQVAALKQIEIVRRDRILENVNTVGTYLGDRLRELAKTFPVIGDVRQVGLHIGAEMIDPKTGEPMDAALAKKVRDRAIEKGLILGTGGYKKYLLKFKPPLIVTKDEADEIVDIFKKTLEEIF